MLHKLFVSILIITSCLMANSLSLNNNGDGYYGGNVLVSGSITAEQYIVSSSVTSMTVAYASGSTEFGDSSDDTHTFKGSILGDAFGILNIGSNVTITGTNLVATNISASGYISASSFVGDGSQQAVNYKSITIYSSKVCFKILRTDFCFRDKNVRFHGLS